MEPSPWSQEQELDKRERFKEQLKELEGFQNLSAEQKQYLEATFYIGQRALRSTDKGSAQLIHDMPGKFVRGGDTTEYIGNYISTTEGEGKPDYDRNAPNKYIGSQIFIINEYCHGVIKQLESYAFPDKSRSESKELEWFDVGPVTSYEELKETIKILGEQHRLPFVITIFSHQGNPAHSSLLLGTNKEGELLVWEKKGFGMQFHLAPLKTVFNHYSSLQNWKLRPLKTGPQIEGK